MARGTGNATGEIVRIFDGGSLAGLDDAEVLRRFARGDEAAFEALVARLGPMVLATCRRRFLDEQDAEDAFQATFLVLLKRAGSLRTPELVGPWLHGVAVRVAARIRAQATRRRQDERRAVRPEGVADTHDLAIESAELRAAIDAEIARLPERDRRAVVLCLLEGRSHEEAARRLRCTVGSVRGRIDKARRTLKSRLMRRGVAPAAALALISATGESTAAVPALLMAETASMLAKAATAEAISDAIAPGVLNASRGVIRGMLAARLTAAAAVVLGLGLLGMIAAPLVIAIEPAPRVEMEARRPSDMETPKDEGIAVTGRVTDEAGAPIAGATIAVGRDFREKEPDAEAMTDAEGRFTVKGLAAGPIVLTVQAKGHAPDLLSTTVAAGMKPIELELKPPHVIRGRIVDPDGKPIADAPIAADEWRGQHTLRWQTWTDAEGRFRWDVAPGDSVLIDLGTLGYSAKRFWQAMPDGPEKTLTMRRPLRVRGKVTDAETGRPILEYTLVPGESSPGSQACLWRNDRTEERRGSSFEANLSTDIAGDPVLRVEARGYAPAVSRHLEASPGEVEVNFALRRGDWIEGEVRLPNGTPAAGAEVVAFQKGLQMSNGHLALPWSPSPHRVVKTRRDGSFRMPSPDVPCTVMAFHDGGFASLPHGKGGRPPTLRVPSLTLQAWGRIEGRLLLKGRPAPGEMISLDRVLSSALPVGVSWLNSAKTDGEGRFSMDRVPAGEVHVTRQIAFGNGVHGGGPPSRIAATRPGETTSLTLGDSGRAVIGKAAPPADLAGKDGWRFAPGLVSRLRPAPADSRQPVEGGSFPVEADGSFRIDGLPPGTYDLQIPIHPHPTDPSRGPFGQVDLGIARREVVIPDQPTGPDAPPLDLGTITLEGLKPASDRRVHPIPKDR
ncbi:sigma-70 family RNA polymerase sigma factor [Aquisphaera insulae]|uniref:sigma-70 family RNA polymerase sigma factor n=1 Tax=Aquisphaera insulae TaxID=2712864 RepID=UPI0013ECEB46|nr:sigma-70 family RNA polymerase sigma factor [Aquisphaera insulae]